MRARVAESGGLLVLAGSVALLVTALWLREWSWPRFGVPGGDGFSFLDVRFFTATWECVRAGVDVELANPCDPLGRPLNYPHVWLAPAGLGIGQGSTSVLGAGLVLVFLGSFVAAIGRIGAWDGVVYAAALCSPSVLLGIERGNADLLVFALVVGAVLLLQAAGRPARVAAHALMLAAAVLKLYPVLAWVPLLRQPRRRLVLGLGATGAVFALTVLVTLDDVRAIQRLAPTDVLFSYGAPILGDRVGGTRVVLLAGAAGALLLVLAARRSGPAPLSAATADASRDLDLFWAGAGVYVGTFALAHNYNYRLVFLLLVLPQLLRWTREPRPAVPLAGLALTAVLASLWLGASLSPAPLAVGEWWEDVSAGFPYDELVDLVLLAYLAGALALTVPAGIRLSRPDRRSRAARRAAADRPGRTPPARTSARP